MNLSHSKHEHRPPHWFRDLQRPEPVQHERPLVELTNEDATDVEALNRLWRSVLAALLQDGCRHWQGLRTYKACIPDYEQEQAFDDLCRVGPMLRHVCSFTGHDPDAVSEAFIRWCEGQGE